MISGHFWAFTLFDSSTKMVFLLCHWNLTKMFQKKKSYFLSRFNSIKSFSLSFLSIFFFFHCPHFEAIQLLWQSSDWLRAGGHAKLDRFAKKVTFALAFCKLFSCRNWNESSGSGVQLRGFDPERRRRRHRHRRHQHFRRRNLLQLFSASFFLFLILPSHFSSRTWHHVFSFPMSSMPVVVSRASDFGRWWRQRRRRRQRRWRRQLVAASGQI